MENKIKDNTTIVSKTNSANIIYKIYDNIFINKINNKNNITDKNKINNKNVISKKNLDKPKEWPLLTEFEEYFIFWN